MDVKVAQASSSEVVQDGREERTDLECAKIAKPSTKLDAGDTQKKPLRDNLQETRGRETGVEGRSEPIKSGDPENEPQKKEEDEQSEHQSEADKSATIKGGGSSRSTTADKINEPLKALEERNSTTEGNVYPLRRLRKTKVAKSEEEPEKAEVESNKLPDPEPQVDDERGRRTARQRQDSPKPQKVDDAAESEPPVVGDAKEVGAAGLELSTAVTVVEEEEVEPGNLRNVPQDVEDEINEQSMKSEHPNSAENVPKKLETESSETKEEDGLVKAGNRPVRRARQSNATVVPEKPKANTSASMKNKAVKKSEPTVNTSSAPSVGSSISSSAPRGPEMSIMAFLKKKKEDAMNKSRAARRGRPPKGSPGAGRGKPVKGSAVAEKPAVKDEQGDRKVERPSRLAKSAKERSTEPSPDVPKKAELKSDVATPKIEQPVRRGRPPKSIKAEERTKPTTSPSDEVEKPEKSEGRTSPSQDSEAKSDGKGEDAAQKPRDDVRQIPSRTRRKAAAEASETVPAPKKEGDAEFSKSAAGEEATDAISPRRRGRPRKASGQEEAAAPRKTPEKSPRPSRSANQKAEEPATATAAGGDAAAAAAVSVADASTLDLKLQTPSKAKVVLHVMSESDIEKKMSPPKAELSEDGAAAVALEPPAMARGRKRARKSSERSSDLSEVPADENSGVRPLRTRQPPRKEEANQREPPPTTPPSLPSAEAASIAASTRRRPKRVVPEADGVSVANDTDKDVKATGAESKPEEVAEAATSTKTSPEKSLPTETSELMKQKGVTVSKDGKRLMIPSQKLTLPPELCKAVTGEGDKKQKFRCQVCQKTFLRRDKINYHVYSEHREEFVRMGGQGMPKILKKPQEKAAVAEGKQGKAAESTSGAGKEMRAMGKKLLAKSRKMVMAATKRKREESANKSGREVEEPRVTRQKSQAVQDEKVPEKTELKTNPTPEATPTAPLTKDETPSGPAATRSPSPPPPVDLDKTNPELAALDTSVKDLDEAISRLLAVRRENGRHTRLVSSPQGKSALKRVRRLARRKREKKYSLFSYPTLLRLKRLRKNRPQFDVKAVDEKTPLVVKITRRKLPGELDRLRPRAAKKSPEEGGGNATGKVETATPTAAAAVATAAAGDASKKRGRPRKLAEENLAKEAAKPEAAADLKEDLPRKKSAVTAAAGKESGGDSARVTAESKSAEEPLTARPKRGNVTAAAIDDKTEEQPAQEPTVEIVKRGRPRRVDPQAAPEQPSTIPESPVDVKKGIQQREATPARAEAPVGVVAGASERKGRGRPKKTELVTGVNPALAESAATATPTEKKASRGRPKAENDDVQSPPAETPPPMEKRSTRPKPKPGALAEDKIEMKVIDEDDKEDEQPLRPKRARSKSGEKKRDSGAAGSGGDVSSPPQRVGEAASSPAKRRRPTGEDGGRRRSPDKLSISISSPPPPLNPCTLKIKISPNPELASRTSPGSPTKTPEGKENTGGIKLVLKASSASTLAVSATPVAEVAEMSVVAQGVESSTGAESSQKYVVRSSGDNPLKLKVKKKKKKKEKEKERKEGDATEGEDKGPLKLTLKLPCHRDGAGGPQKKHKRKRPKENHDEVGKAQGESSQEEKEKHLEEEPKPERQQQPQSFKLRIKSPHRLLEQPPPSASTSESISSAATSQSSKASESSSVSRREPPKENVQRRQQPPQQPKLPTPPSSSSSISGSSRDSSSHVVPAASVARRSGSCVDTTTASPSTSAASNRETGRSKFDRLQQQQSHPQHGRGEGQQQQHQAPHQQAVPSQYPHYHQQPQQQGYNNALGAWQQQQQQEYFDKMLMHAAASGGRYSSSTSYAAAMADNAAAMAAMAAMTQFQQQQQQQPYDNNIQDAAMAAMMMMTAGTSSAMGVTGAQAAAAAAMGTPPPPPPPPLHRRPQEQPQPQVTFSPDSSPEHVGEGMASFNNLLSVIDSSDEAAGGAGTSGGQRRPAQTGSGMPQGQGGDSAIVPRRATSGNRLVVGKSDIY